MTTKAMETTKTSTVMMVAVTMAVTTTTTSTVSPTTLNPLTVTTSHPQSLTMGNPSPVNTRKLPNAPLTSPTLHTVAVPADPIMQIGTTLL